MAMFFSQTKAIEDNIEDLLASLDEFSHLADTVRSSLFEEPINRLFTCLF